MARLSTLIHSTEFCREYRKDKPKIFTSYVYNCFKVDTDWTISIIITLNVYRHILIDLPTWTATLSMLLKRDPWATEDVNVWLDKTWKSCVRLFHILTTTCQLHWGRIGSVEEIWIILQFSAHNCTTEKQSGEKVITFYKKIYFVKQSLGGVDFPLTSKNNKSAWKPLQNTEKLSRPRLNYN